MVLGNVDHSVLGFGPVGRAARNALGTLPARVRTPMEDKKTDVHGCVQVRVFFRQKDTPALLHEQSVHKVIASKFRVFEARPPTKHHKT